MTWNDEWRRSDPAGRVPKVSVLFCMDCDPLTSPRYQAPFPVVHKKTGLKRLLLVCPRSEEHFFADTYPREYGANGNGYSKPSGPLYITRGRPKGRAMPAAARLVRLTSL